MITYGKNFLLALAASSVLGKPSPPTSSPIVPCAPALGSSPSAVATKPLEGLVKVLNRVPVEGGDVDVEDELRTTASSNNSEDLDVIARVKVGGLRASAGNSCLGSGHNGNPEKYSPKRDGKSYNFNIFEMDAECRDANNFPYEWGEFTNVVSATECAEKCVTLPDASLVEGGTFRGFEFACLTKQCRCLYDAGTLSTNTRSASSGYSRTKTNQAGEGSIVNYSAKSGYYCAKLVGAATLEVTVE